MNNKIIESSLSSFDFYNLFTKKLDNLKNKKITKSINDNKNNNKNKFDKLLLPKVQKIIDPDFSFDFPFIPNSSFPNAGTFFVIIGFFFNVLNMHDFQFNYSSLEFDLTNNGTDNFIFDVTFIGDVINNNAILFTLNYNVFPGTSFSGTIDNRQLNSKDNSVTISGKPSDMNGRIIYNLLNKISAPIFTGFIEISFSSDISVISDSFRTCRNKDCVDMSTSQISLSLDFNVLNNIPATKVLFSFPFNLDLSISTNNFGFIAGNGVFANISFLVGSSGIYFINCSSPLLKASKYTLALTTSLQVIS